jgi:hypothetical protein
MVLSCTITTICIIYHVKRLSTHVCLLLQDLGKLLSERRLGCRDRLPAITGPRDPSQECSQLQLLHSPLGHCDMLFLQHACLELCNMHVQNILTCFFVQHACSSWLQSTWPLFPDAASARRSSVGDRRVQSGALTASPVSQLDCAQPR